MVLKGRTLYLSIGDGGLMTGGTLPGTQIPNPAGPPAPIMSSILKIRLSSDVDSIMQAFTLTPAQYTTLFEGHSVSLRNAVGDRAEIEILSAFRYYVRDQFLGIRQSDPYALVMPHDQDGDDDRGDRGDGDGKLLYVADSGMDAIVKVDAESGRLQTVVKFDRVQNPAGGTLDAVPNSIRRFGDQFLVSLMSGAPFLQGLSRIQLVNPRTGNNRPFILNLTGAVDVLPQKLSGNRDRIFTLEFPISRLMRFDSGVGTLVATELMNSTSMVLDPRSGDLFVTSFGAGKIFRVRVP
jgi:hypothetical protein